MIINIGSKLITLKYLIIKDNYLEDCIKLTSLWQKNWAFSACARTFQKKYARNAVLIDNNEV